MKLFDLALLILLGALIFGNAKQFQDSFDRCKSSDFKESKCELHKKNYERGLKK